MSVLSDSARNLRPSVFSQILPRIQALGDRAVPLHIGDTYRLPPEPARAALLRAAEESQQSTRFFAYTHPQGRPQLRDALAQKLRRENGIPSAPERVQITCGATQGLAASAQAILNPGDEVLLLSPHWPLIRGVLQSVGATFREVSYSQAVRDPHAVLTPLLGPRTRAVYLANPNNPDGAVLGVEQASYLYRFAEEHELFILADEAYEHILYDGVERGSLGALDEPSGQTGRVLSVFTFSKSFGLAGLRIGYVSGPASLMQGVVRVSTHQIYNLSDLVQEVALAAVGAPREEYNSFLRDQCRAYRQARDLLLEAFPTMQAPVAGAYLFVPFASGDEAWSVLEQWMEKGLCAAPGEAFGADFAHCLRLCFTAVPTEQIARAVQIVRTVAVDQGE